MLFPSKENFLKTAKRNTVMPVYTEILADMETPVSAFQKIKDTQYAFLLESVESGINIGRFSFIGFMPKIIFKSSGRKVELTIDGKTENHDKDNPLKFLEETVLKYKPISNDNLDTPFWGGPVGYIGYDYVRFFENIPDSCKPSLSTPDLFFVVMKNILIFDQLKHKILIIYNAFIDNEPELAYRQGVESIQDILHKFQKPKEEKKLFFFNTQEGNRIDSSFKREDFIEAVKKIKEYIVAGDILQCVLSQRFQTTLNVEPFNVYRALRVVNPSPYMFYLHFDDLKIVGSSPEVMVKKENDTVILKPIAGTKPRGKTDEEDLQKEQELISDEKERAEHLMLVDLGRNDIGRIAEKGSVKVENFMSIEKYSHVMHIVSTVKGRINLDIGLYELIKATFPAGTVSGAPKIRAMEIIEELEPIKREIYSGLVGYYSFSKNFDSCITIRTIIQKDDCLYIQAGAGIVADSVPEKEYEETVNKAKALIRAIEIARGGLQ